MKPLARPRLAIGAVALIAVAGFAWVVATQGPLAPIRVTVAKAGETTLPLSLFGIGTVEARRSYNIGPTAAGRVASVLVDQGDVVAAGQVLAEMDPVDLEERLAAGSASAERAAQLVRSAEAALAEAASRARLAQANADRYADLRRRNFVSQEAADARAHEAAAARAGLDAAGAALAAARDELGRAHADRAGTGKVRSHLRLVSPVAAIVTARLAEPGSTVVAGQSVVQVIDPSSLWLRTRIDQGRSAGLVPGLPAEIVLRSQPRQVLAGRVARVDLVGDPVTEERVASIAFAELPAGLTIGELAEVTLRLAPVQGALALPSAAVKRVGNTDGVWLLQDGRTLFRPVTVGPGSLEGLTQILAGPGPDDTVIVHSSQPLAPDMRVKVVDSLARGGP